MLIGDSTTAAVDSPAKIDLTAKSSSVGSSASARKPAARPKKMISVSSTLAVETGVHQQPGTAGEAVSTLPTVGTLDVRAVSINSATKKKAIHQKK